jgi:hypothetical protein
MLILKSHLLDDDQTSGSHVRIVCPIIFIKISHYHHQGQHSEGRNYQHYDVYLTINAYLRTTSDNGERLL